MIENNLQTEKPKLGKLAIRANSSTDIQKKGFVELDNRVNKAFYTRIKDLNEKVARRNDGFAFVDIYA